MNKELSRPRAVLLDWDNTLVDSFPVIHRSINHTLEAMGLTAWSYEKTRRTTAASMRDFFPKLYGNRWEEARDIYTAHYAARDLDSIIPFPGAENLLITLKNAGFYLALVSNKTGGYLREEVSYLGWRDYFTRVVGAADAARDKPDPAVIERALEGSGIKPGRDVWFVGDNAVDVDCALAAGCVPLVIQDAFAEDENPALNRAERKFRDCPALAELVRQLQSINPPLINSSR